MTPRPTIYFGRSTMHGGISSASTDTADCGLITDCGLIADTTRAVHGPRFAVSPQSAVGPQSVMRFRPQSVMRFRPQSAISPQSVVQYHALRTHQIPRQKVEPAANEEAHLQSPALLSLKLRHQVRSADVKRDTRRQRETVRAQRREVLGQEPTDHRSEAEGATRGQRASSR